MFLLKRFIRHKFSTSAKRTCLYDIHLQNHAKLVQFAGYELPIQYKPGIMKQHLHCRSLTSIFDVSHMGQISICGKDAQTLLERVTVGSTNRKQTNINGIEIIQGYLTLFLNQNAGIIDDAIACVVKKNYVRLVVNGANKHTVMKHLQNVMKQEKFNVDVKLHDDLGLIALQGPASQKVLQTILDRQLDLRKVPFMGQTSFKTSFDGGQECYLSRSGYTGEDGFQISASGNTIASITNRLLQFKNEIMLAGLGARDSLRTQAGLCLHGHDITPSITPLQSALMWCVYKPQSQSSRATFIGEQKLRSLVQDVKNKKKNISKRVGFMVEGAGIVREHCKIKDGNKYIGQTTTGIYSPSLKKCIGMAYVDSKYAKEGTKIQVEQRGKVIEASIKKMPFLNPNYYKEAKWQ